MRIAFDGWRTSTRSAAGSGGNCVEVGIGQLDPCTWHKTSVSGGSQGNCVEVADGNTVIGVRDSKDRDGGHLVVTTCDWTHFVTSL